MKIDTSINTIGAKHHVWALTNSSNGIILREGISPSLSKAMKAICEAKKLAKKSL